MKYQHRYDRNDYWEIHEPVPVISALLTEYPDAIITLGNGTMWRVRPRDASLLRDLEPITGVIGATEVYDLLEQRGLV